MEPNQEQNQTMQNSKKINPKLIIAIVSVLLLVALGGGYYYLSSKKSDNINTMTNQNKEITKEEARGIALREISKSKPDTFIILDDKTQENSSGWIFFYDTKKYIETGDVKYKIPGNVPIMVSRIDGSFEFSGRFLTQEEPSTKVEIIEKYLEKTDPTYILLASRVIVDIDKAVQSADVFNPQNKDFQKKIKAFTKEEKKSFTDKFYSVFEENVCAYMVKTRIVSSLEKAEGIMGASTYVSNLQEFSKKEEMPGMVFKNNGYDMRVLSIGNNEYIVEYWIDWSKVPGTYSRIMAEGGTPQTERYEKDQAVWYTVTPDGSIVFHNPFQELEDFIRQYFK